MKLIEEALIEYYGERCPDFADGCPCCEAWAEFDELITRIKELENDVAKREDHRGKLMKGYRGLETQLAAVKEAHKSLLGDKTMEGILWPDVKPTDLITIRVQKQIYDKARAALGEKI